MEKNSRKFSLVWKGSVLIQKLCSRRKAQAACERKIGLRLSRPLCPWLGMSWESGTSAQVVRMWHYFPCPTYQRCKGKVPLSPLKLGRLNRIHFPKDPFMEEHHQCGWQVIAEGSMARSVGWVERGTPCASSHVWLSEECWEAQLVVTEIIVTEIKNTWYQAKMYLKQKNLSKSRNS